MQNNATKSQDIYYSFQDFFLEVGVLTVFKLKDLGLHPDLLIGEFEPDRLEELQEFCLKNPEYHIISRMRGGCMYNRAMNGVRHYYLGIGNANPRLIYKGHLLPSQIFKAL